MNMAFSVLELHFLIVFLMRSVIVLPVGSWSSCNCNCWLIEFSDRDSAKVI